MALINVKKKIEKAAGDLGIAEPILAACSTNPAGTVNRMVARELAGLAGALMKTDAGGAPEVGLATQFPNGRHFLVLTDRRLLLTSITAMKGNPKEIVAEWPRTDVVDITVRKGTLAAPLQIVFSDGTAIAVEGAKGTDPGSIAKAFGQSET